MNRDVVDGIIRDFGATFGNSELMLDEDDFVCFTTAGGVLINIDYFEDSESLVLYTTIGEIFDATRLSVYDELLKANFFWELSGGATLSVNPAGTHALLTASIMAVDLDVLKLTNVIEHMNQLTYAWAARMREITKSCIAEAHDEELSVSHASEANPSHFA